MFTWPVSSPFAILHVNLWIPGHYTDSNGYIALMNVICDMCQFVVVVPVPDEIYATLATSFMQHVLMKYDICRLVVLDDGASFKESFINVCQALNLHYEILVRHNHKGLSVEYFYSFLNKSMIITAE